MKQTFQNCNSLPGVGKLRPAGQMRPAKVKSAAREHVIFLNGMRPAKENFAAREHVNVARWAKIYSKSNSFDKFSFKFLYNILKQLKDFTDLA